jgi:hypothetical protein
MLIIKLNKNSVIKLMKETKNVKKALLSNQFHFYYKSNKHKKADFLLKTPH